MLSNVKEELNRFAKYVITQSRANLTRQKKNSSKALYDSLDSNIKVSKNSFELSFMMEDYGVFQDKGVSGVKKKYNTKYSYTTKMPPPAKLDKWIVKKGIAPRDKEGKFISRKSLQFMIARSVFNNGIKPSLFFTKPFEKAFKNINKDLIKAYRLDVEQLLETSINNK
tara:strand:- start:532 stop:1035 length:504 start_codon:yes stop_codon:yes gene_type:complete